MLPLLMSTALMASSYDDPSGHPHADHASWHHSPSVGAGHESDAAYWEHERVVGTPRDNPVEDGVEPRSLRRDRRTVRFATSASSHDDCAGAEEERVHGEGDDEVGDYGWAPPHYGGLHFAGSRDFSARRSTQGSWACGAAEPVAGGTPHGTMVTLSDGQTFDLPGFWDPDTMRTVAGYLERVHPDGRGSFLEILRRITRVESNFRFYPMILENLLRTINTMIQRNLDLEAQNDANLRAAIDASLRESRGDLGDGYDFDAEYGQAGDGDQNDFVAAAAALPQQRWAMPTRSLRPHASVGAGGGRFSSVSAPRPEHRDGREGAVGEGLTEAGYVESTDGGGSASAEDGYQDNSSHEALVREHLPEGFDVGSDRENDDEEGDTDGYGDGCSSGSQGDYPAEAVSATSHANTSHHDGVVAEEYQVGQGGAQAGSSRTTDAEQTNDIGRVYPQPDSSCLSGNCRCQGVRHVYLSPGTTIDPERIQVRGLEGFRLANGRMVDLRGIPDVVKRAIIIWSLRNPGRNIFEEFRRVFLLERQDADTEHVLVRLRPDASVGAGGGSFSSVSAPRPEHRDDREGARPDSTDGDWDTDSEHSSDEDSGEGDDGPQAEDGPPCGRCDACLERHASPSGEDDDEEDRDEEDDGRQAEVRSPCGRCYDCLGIRASLDGYGYVLDMAPAA